MVTVHLLAYTKCIYNRNIYSHKDVLGLGLNHIFHHNFPLHQSNTDTHVLGDIFRFLLLLCMSCPVVLSKHPLVHPELWALLTDHIILEVTTLKEETHVARLLQWGMLLLVLCFEQRASDPLK
jgi:hypothetical protein